MVRARAALLVLFAAGAVMAQRPAISVSGDRVLVALPDSVLKDGHVKSRLESALTTTFIMKTSLGGGARIEIRYDLWDEVYRVRRNNGAQQTIARKDLEPWWRTPIDGGRADGNRIDVELIVLPFSAAEETDARQWLSKSGGAGTPAGGDRSSIVDVLIGTTLNARPVVSFRWMAVVPRR
jgi:hypothetical protein